jgi:Protein of unknown function (DUF3108)
MRRIAVAALTLIALGPFTVQAQRASQGRSDQRPGQRPARHPAQNHPTQNKIERPVPFKVGETLTYNLAWSSIVTVGTASATISEKKPSYNSTAYYIVAEARPIPIVARLYSLYYKLDTLLDSYTLLPQRGSVYSEEGRRHRFKVTRFDQASHKAFFEYRSTGTAEKHFTVLPYTQDALSAIYVLRAVTLKVGDRMTMPVSDNGLSYMLQVDVGPSERVRTPFGESNAWKLKLGIFDSTGRPQGRNVSIWISDDARRLPVKVQGELPVGTFNLDLREVK